MFQFHTGSIKRYKRGIGNASIAMFQFHTGSIKSPEEAANEIVSLMFQFHTGSIKRIAYGSEVHIDVTAFQFHTGSIKRSRRSNNRNAPRPRFNSTLVRLKAAQTPDSEGRVVSFNSTLVRLKVIPAIIVTIYAISFQFHTGSIKRCPK